MRYRILEKPKRTPAPTPQPIIIPELKWKYQTPTEEKCVLVGVDHNHEWLLDWWYENYKRTNNYPILFADLGMSQPIRLRCLERGLVTTPPQRTTKVWFMKPLSILQSQYRLTVWMDIDCEVRQDIKEIFNYAEQGFAVTIDPYNRFCKIKNPVASGVVAVKHNNELAAIWAARCLCEFNKYRGDQEVLNNIIGQNKQGVTIMPPQYQRLRLGGEAQDAVIYHWTGHKGREAIKANMKK